jgi:hypothetical protein
MRLLLNKKYAENCKMQTENKLARMVASLSLRRDVKAMLIRKKMSTMRL